MNNQKTEQPSSASAVMAGYDDYKPTKLYWHEALDRASLAVDFFHDHVEQHPAIQHDLALKAAAQKITSLMADFYQRVGGASFGFSGSTDES